jgi:uncharacterized membrane protein YkoI
VSKSGEVMNKGARHGRRALLCCLLCAGLAVAPVQAEREDARRETSGQQQGQRDGGAARAAAIAQARHGGKVLKVSPQGGSFYKVRLLLPDGTVKSVTVDAGG